MIDNQQFIEATNFIKNTKKLTFGKIASAIGIERHILDNIRRGSQAPSKHNIDELVKVFPESAKFFASKIEDIVNDSEQPSIYVKLEPGMVIGMQQEMIAMLKAEIERKQKMVERLRKEVEDLRKMSGK